MWLRYQPTSPPAYQPNPLLQATPQYHYRCRYHSGSCSARVLSLAVCPPACLPARSLLNPPTAPCVPSNTDRRILPFSRSLSHLRPALPATSNNRPAPVLHSPTPRLHNVTVRFPSSLFGPSYHRDRPLEFAAPLTDTTTCPRSGSFPITTSLAPNAPHASLGKQLHLDSNQNVTAIVHVDKLGRQRLPQAGRCCCPRPGCCRRRAAVARTLAPFLHTVHSGREDSRIRRVAPQAHRRQRKHRPALLSPASSVLRRAVCLQGRHYIFRPRPRNQRLPHCRRAAN
jgi:hypothetical protein